MAPRKGDMNKHDLKFSLDMLRQNIMYLSAEHELWGDRHLENMQKHINNLAEITGVELEGNEMYNGQ